MTNITLLRSLITYNMTLWGNGRPDRLDEP